MLITVESRQKSLPGLIEHKMEAAGGMPAYLRYLHQVLWWAEVGQHERMLQEGTHVQVIVGVHLVLLRKISVQVCKRAHRPAGQHAFGIVRFMECSKICANAGVHHHYTLC